ncbi:DUF5703 family protein [Rarobacter incanus]|uniref:Uncharacterized protein n=1 Tax=Rarobacter incanus TaxID=153494 RepID=A0A542SMQ0_9MICO|nr:DUF5703 family protein [Rarobacter incanus]TQK75765.1 hypothetical protein FB389_0399 [Rarobacter incanus]
MAPVFPREYEVKVITIAPDATRNEARELLTHAAEYGQWEMTRSLWYIGGARKVWLRRRVMRVQATL